jgi:hypothetical protein
MKVSGIDDVALLQRLINALPSAEETVFGVSNDGNRSSA